MVRLVLPLGRDSAWRFAGEHDIIGGMWSLKGTPDRMNDDDRILRPGNHALRTELARLRQEHRDLDAAIDALQSALRPDPLQMQRLKKRKLALKDRIIALEDKLLPDIIA